MDTLPVPEPGFDYTSLEPPARAVAREAAEKIRLHGKRAAESVVAIGEELARSRAAISRDDTFEDWIRGEFDWSRRMAYRFLAVAENRANLAREDLHLVDVSALYVLNSPSTPEPVLKAARGRAAAGERVTHASVKDHVERFKRQQRSSEPAVGERDVDGPLPPPPFAPAAPPGVPASAPAGRGAYFVKAELARSFRKFTVIESDPREVARVVALTSGQVQVRKAKKMISWLQEYVREAEETTRGAA